MQLLNLYPYAIFFIPPPPFQDFEDTMRLVEDYKFPSLFMNQFFPRPGTPAAKMPQVPAQMVSQIKR